MIDGVKKKTLLKHHDDRGYFTELVRDDEDLLAQFGQMSLSMSYPGVIKAFIIMTNKTMCGFFRVAMHKSCCMTLDERLQRINKRMSIIWGRITQSCYSSLKAWRMGIECSVRNQRRLFI